MRPRTVSTVRGRTFVRTICATSCLSFCNHVARAGRLASRCNFRQIREGVHIAAENLSIASACGSGDDQVVGAAWPAAAASMCEQGTVRPGDVDVVALDRDRAEHRIDECPPTASPTVIGERDSDFQLGHGDRGDGDVIPVGNQFLERLRAGALGVDQDGGVEDQSRQGFEGDLTESRSSRSSPAQPGSGSFPRMASLSARPVPALVGPIVATGWP